MSKAKTKETSKAPETQSMTRERQLADMSLDPLLGAAIITLSFSKHVAGETDVISVYDVLNDRAKSVHDDKLSSAEAMLTGHAAILNAMFMDLASRSCANMGKYMPAAESYMRLAFKAQAQCRATIESLTSIRNPPVVYARQANIANGPQQVNNGVDASHTTNRLSPPNELLEMEHGKRMEFGTTGAAIGGDPALETVGAIDGAANCGRKSARQPQRRQGRKAASAED